MKAIAIKDLNSGHMIPLADGDFEFIRILGISAEFNRAWFTHKFLIADCIRCGIWKGEYYDLPEIDEMPDSDEMGIISNEDRTK